MCANMDYIKDMKRKQVFSKTLILRILSKTDLFEDVFKELKEIKFGNLKFDYIDIENIFNSELRYEYKTDLAKYLLYNNKIDISRQVIDILHEHNLLSQYPYHEVKGRTSIIETLKYESFTNNNLSIGVNYKSINIVGLGKIIYLPCLKIYIYHDFVGSLTDFISYIFSCKFNSSLKLKASGFALTSKFI